MKANLLLLLWIALGFQASAQGTGPVIGPNNVPPPGSTIIVNPVIPNGLDPGLSGENREYNFAYCISKPLEHLVWKTPTAAQSENFPAANIITNYYGRYRRLYENPKVNLPYIPSNYYNETYLLSDNNGLTILGNANADTYNVLANGDTVIFFQQKAPYKTPRVTLPYGLKYGDNPVPETTVQEFMGVRLSGGDLDTFKIVRRTKTTVSADGVGRISTPSAYFDDALRVRTQIEEVDSLFLNNGFFIEKYEMNRLNPTQYSWYVPQKNWEVFTMIMDGTDVLYAGYLVDDEKPIVNIARLNSIIPENIGLIKIPVRLSQPSADTVTVMVNTVDSRPQATEYEDYIPVKNQVLTFYPGETLKTVDLVILEDSTIEKDEAFVLQISNPSENANIGTVRFHYVNILDDDRPYLHFTSTDTTILENAGIIYVPLKISKPLQDSVKIRIRTVARNATPALDYFSFDYIHSIRPNDVIIPIPIKIIDDLLNEELETFVVQISAESENIRIGYSDTIAIHIQDNEFKPNVRFMSSTVSVSEATNEPGNVFTIPLRLGYKSSEPITVTYELINGTATSASNQNFFGGGDFFSANNSATFMPGTTTADIVIGINNDEDVEGDQYFFVNLLKVSEWGQMGFRDTILTVIIKDNDPFVSVDPQMIEDGLTVYPNPSKGSVTVKHSDKTNIDRVLVTDMLGKTIELPFVKNTNTLIIDMNGFVNGIYQLRIEAGDKVYHQKVILNK